MKTIKLTAHHPSLADLLNMARQDTVLLKTPDGDSFVVSSADDLATEVELLRRNHSFLAMLDELKAKDETVPLEEAEKKLR